MNGSGNELLQKLESAAKRLRLQRWTRDGAWGAGAWSLLAAAHEVIRHGTVEAAVLTAVRPLLAMTAIAVAVVVVLRGMRLPAQETAAAEIDTRAGLADDFLSACWFARDTAPSALAALHLDRVAELGRDLDLSRTFPLRVPRGSMALVTGAMLAIVTAALWPGRLVEHDPDSRLASARKADPSGEAGGNGDVGAGESDGDAEPAGAAEERGRAGLWKEVEAMARDLVGNPNGQALAEAIAARDARQAARALRAAQEASTSGDGVAGQESPGDQMNETVAKDILARLESLLAEEPSMALRRPAQGTPDDKTGTARLDRELRQDDDDAQRAARRDATPGEDAVNTSLRALSRSSTAGRDAVHGEADSTEGAGRANVSGGALGRRINTTTAGSGEGDQPTTTAAPPPKDDAVLGARTQRLAVQLKAVEVTQDDKARPPRDDDPSGTEEAFYAATRAQASRAVTTAVQAVSRSAAEDVIARESAPLAYRDAVKRYTLSRHGREPRVAADASAVR